METWQINYVRKNLPTLIQHTVCSTGLLVSLYADGIVSDDDIQTLEAISTQRAQAKRLYEIIQTRKDSFNLLKQALKDTAQSGALDILDQCTSPNVPIQFKNCGNISYIRDLLLGDGCFGTVVFKGKFENRDVAVKRLNRDPVKMIDVEKEVNFLTLLDSHKNVVRYFKTEVSEDFIFIALELCDVNLFDWVMQVTKIVEIGVMEVIKQTTEGVAHLHSNRVIHRDLKPTNILLVSRSVGDAQVKISDFGLSKRIPVGVSKLIGHTAGVGTVEWMAPEVAGGLSLQNNVAVGMSFASDIFSLGCVYYFVLSGGLHAFGEPPRCQVNIMDGKYELNEINIVSMEGDVSGLIKLISEMIAQERRERPTILEVLTWLPEVLSSKKSVKVPTAQQNAIEGESVKGKHTSGQIVDANPGNVGIVSAMKSKLMLENVNKRKGIQTTKFPPTVTATPDVQLTKMEGTQEHKLHVAIQVGDIQGMKKLIQLGADVNAKSSKNEAPLMIAAASSKVYGNMIYYVVRYLMDHGADMLDADGEDYTFLHKLFQNTSASGFGAFAQYLVDNNLASLFNTQDISFGTTPFMLAMRNVQLDMATISLLRENGVDVALVDKNGASYLSYAAEGNKNVKLLAELMKRGEIKHNKLAEAIKAIDGDSVKVLVSLGADVNETTDELKTPLHLAALLQNMNFAVPNIKFLIDSGANVNAKDKDGNIFLHLLFNENTTITLTQFDDIATYLISKDLSRLFNTPGQNGHTPFQIAVWVEIDRATLSLLKNNGVDFNAADYQRRSVLYYATLCSRLRMISDLVDLGANPNHLTTDKENMVHAAALNPNPQVIKFFVDKGLDINAQDNDGETPLHYALSCVNKEAVLKTVQILLQNGAKSDIIDKYGKSPRDYFNAYRHEYPETDKISNCFSLGSSC